MEWQDQGIVLSVRPHGESSAVVSLLTEAHGRHAGLARGALGARGRAIYQTGNEVAAVWRARLAEHLGAYSCELVTPWPSDVLDDSLRLSALAAACAVAESVLPEREPHAAVFHGLRALLAAFGGEGWEAAYIGWELAVLRELGFGLDLGSCAATGAVEDLIYVSPRTGRAVSRAAGETYKDRLLRLPGFLTGHDDTPPAEEIVQGLRLTGHFLARNVWSPAGRPEPPARTRLVDRLFRETAREA